MVYFVWEDVIRLKKLKLAIYKNSNLVFRQPVVPQGEETTPTYPLLSVSLPEGSSSEEEGGVVLPHSSTPLSSPSDMLLLNAVILCNNFELKYFNNFELKWYKLCTVIIILY